MTAMQVMGVPGFLVVDPMYFVFVGPAMLLAIWAQWRVQRAYSQAQGVIPSQPLTGAETAELMLHKAGVRGVGIEQTEGFLSDHYDPRDRVLRLSPDVYHGVSAAAMGIAAHEAGHALQHAGGYPMLRLRNAAVPLASVGGSLSMVLLVLGFVLASFQLVVAGIVLFGTTVVFQLINLPVEFDASRRAKDFLRQAGLVHGEPDRAVKRVLGAAALTYVAATVSGIATLLYYVVQSGMLGGSSTREE